MIERRFAAPASALVIAGTVRAQTDYRSKPAVPRAVSPMCQDLGQQVTVENKPGSGTTEIAGYCYQLRSGIVPGT